MVRYRFDLLLLVLLVGTLVLAWSIGRDVSQPNYESLVEGQMGHSPAYQAFDANPNFADGLTLRVPPDQSVFDVVSQAGVSVLGSCFEGVCGTCEQAVLDGAVDHRDSILSDEEREANEYMMICVSRCRSARLTLDL